MNRCASCGSLRFSDFYGCDEDCLREFLANAREVAAKKIQAQLMAKAVPDAVHLLSGILDDLFNTQWRQLKSCSLDVEVDARELIDAETAIEERRIAEAIYLLEKFMHPAPSARVSSQREMRKVVAS